MPKTFTILGHIVEATFFCKWAPSVKNTNIFAEMPTLLNYHGLGIKIGLNK